ncbi:MAG: hypothetical protein OEW16_10445 [Gammaproteobacteria bacterium]|nr:hypothetical protein [Gammaproteobacteria bacterium]
MKLTRRRLVTGMLATALAWPCRAQGRDHAVLVTAESDPDLSLATLEVRKLFLGFTVVHDGRVLQPVRNRSDDLLDQIFLQHVVSMSAEAYERRLLARFLRQGRARPREVRSREELLRALTSVRHSVSYAWQADVEGVPDVHVIRTLWRA